MPRSEIQTTAQLDAHLDAGDSLRRAIFQDLDLRRHEAALLAADLTDTVFLGCALTPAMLARLQDQRGLVFPASDHVPYSLYRATLYAPEELLADGPEHDYEDTLDARIYDHYQASGGAKPKDAFADLCRRLHDHAMTDARDEFLVGRTVVAVMGGHALRRDEPLYAQVAELGRALARRGYTVATGGGPGAMEAAHLGAHLAGYPDATLPEAVGLLSVAPTYEPRDAWLRTGLEVKARFPHLGESVSLGIPTWFYGHEPPNPFPSHIAKYFANALREEGLLAVATAGIVFAPGSAGTNQEVFQDVAQNHYSTFGSPSPMVFLDKEHWTTRTGIYPLIEKLAVGKAYADLLSCVDNPADAVAAVEAGNALRRSRMDSQDAPTDEL